MTAPGTLIPKQNPALRPHQVELRQTRLRIHRCRWTLWG